MLFKVLLLAFLVTIVMGDSIEQQWDNYKKQYGKSYPPGEDAERFEIFKKSVKNINEINKQYDEGTGTWKAELNKFADLREDEKKQLQGLLGGKHQGATGVH